LEQADVGRDDVAWYQVGDVDRGWRAVADDHGLVPDLVMERFGGLLGPELVDESQSPGQRDDHADDDRLAPIIRSPTSRRTDQTPARPRRLDQRIRTSRLEPQVNAGGRLLAPNRLRADTHGTLDNQMPPPHTRGPMPAS
jgi:hypothetical protein